MPAKKRFTTIGIDLFAGAGGLSLGAKMAGIDVSLAVEKNYIVSETYTFNHNNTTLLNEDVANIKQIPAPIMKSSKQKILFGGPPCQGFSTSNRRTRHRNNPQNWLYTEFIRILKLWQPDWVVFENVTGIVNFESRNFVYKIVSDFEATGYTCSHAILNASDFGIPQRRKRFFLVGSKAGITIQLQKETNQPTVTVRDAFNDLPYLTNGASVDVLPYAQPAQNEYTKKLRGQLLKSTGHLVSKNSNYVMERYKHIHQGDNWKAIPKELMKNYTDCSRCHTGIYYRLKENEPSVVIGNYRKNMLIHPWVDRGLSVREAARLQSFPDNYVFKGSIGFQQQQVGNAVPPLLAEHVFRKIIERNGEAF
ncbi:MAG: DNA cytosine methyltransferase [Candidatus Bathyarchaeota archaeon]|nr:DNA cytosine methyltransferase [Candidatus Termiticorpusculum sp.]